MKPPETVVPKEAPKRGPKERLKDGAMWILVPVGGAALFAAFVAAFGEIPFLAIFAITLGMIYIYILGELLASALEPLMPSTRGSTRLLLAWGIFAAIAWGGIVLFMRFRK